MRQIEVKGLYGKSHAVEIELELNRERKGNLLIGVIKQEMSRMFLEQKMP